ncbi:HNH endonuclease [Rhodobacteraceae bacterium 63075]|nr:HNH endonuclease [Rhodobacteraceae bacterium 63075]
MANNLDRVNCPNAYHTRKRLEKLGFEIFDEKATEANKARSEFQENVRRAAEDTQQVRARRLRAASSTPERYVSEVVVYKRNPDVVAERLSRANGQCENCNQPAPFRRQSDNTPYLEVHHVKPLAEGGEDSLENTQALCPNCHRAAHFG